MTIRVGEKEHVAHMLIGGTHYVPCGRCPEPRIDREHLLGGCPAGKGVAEVVWKPGTTVREKMEQPLKVVEFLRRTGLLPEPRNAGSGSSRVVLAVPTSAFVGSGPCA
eukprot:TRINITY_DN4624_c0_g1_i1.p2 TRINITY_DN4624_c0_g1~~TRINITY_DN4624_c0_g1_i1.p2  ORF type:complete len:108 (+),score=9.37 TRINITY_DN4624_c0_g1_i1:320-643(+)